MEEIGGSSSAIANNRPELKPEDEEEEDRISELPDVIIQHILSFLPSTKEAMQTGILSKRWRNQWTRVPVLIFSSSGDCFNDYFSQCIDKTLVLHDYPILNKFQIKHVNSEWQLYLQRKINFVVRKYVEELILDCHSYDNDDKFRLPKSLINNAFLVKLELTNCFVNCKWRKINWPSLKSLKLNSFSLPFCSIQNALSGSPLLESLELTNCNSVYRHVLASESLKKLSLVDVNCDDDKDHIEISCPNLEELSVKAWNYVATNLTRKTIECALSGCPLLRLLEVRNFVCSELEIASHSLKKLVLEENDGSCSIEIFCPNLEELNLCALEIGSLKVVNLSSSVGVDRDGIVSKSVARLSCVDVNCDDNGHVKILWPNLEELSVRTSMLIPTLSCQAIEDVLSGCLALRSLELRNFLNDELVIASNSLKRLVLEENFGCCAVEISCPNLEELRLYDLGVVSFKVMNLPSSVCATVNFNFYVRDEKEVKEIIEQFQHVKKLHFAQPEQD